MPARTGETNASPVAAVGWFRSHPRSRLTLSERDLEIANTLFSQPWQVTLVLRPGNSATTRARVFFRESAAPLTAGAGFQEFTLDPPGADPSQESAVSMTELHPGELVSELPRSTDASAVVANAGGVDAAFDVGADGDAGDIDAADDTVREDSPVETAVPQTPARHRADRFPALEPPPAIFPESS